MDKVSGCNLFGQWLLDDPILIDFPELSLCKQINLKSKTTQVKIIHINWAYNIFKIENNYYLSGSWHGAENQFIKLDLPEECKMLPDSTSNLLCTGNDYNLIIVDQHSRITWFINLENANRVKKLSLNVDTPIKREIDAKRVRLDDKITKVVATNNSCLYLTGEGHLYTGLVPSYLDTSHCFGKVIDIACGYEHFVLLTDAGKVYTWGNGRRLQLGHGDITNLDIPTEVEALAGINMSKISAGGWHSLALSEFGDLYAWGWNDTGQLGIKSKPENSQGVLNTEGLKSYPSPTVVDIYDGNDREVYINVIDIGCGSRHSAVLLEDFSIWTTGCNKYGQLGFSPELHGTVNYFKKAFQSPVKAELKCGAWSTVLIKSELL